MSKLHNRFTDEQVRVLFQSYCRGKMSIVDIQEMLAIGKSRFFVLMKEYRKNPGIFSIAYKRRTNSRLSAEIKNKIEIALLREKEIVENPDLLISGYNYTALRDRLRKAGIEVYITTIIDLAKKLGCHKPRRKRKVHDREVLTASIGALIQHDVYLHMWSPMTKKKWTLITSIDDYSRKILFADFFPAETTWAHIRATQALMMSYGLPLRYYVDCLRVFRFVQGRDSFW